MVLVVELDPKEISEDARYPELGANYVPSHLKYYLSKQELLPAARIVADGGSWIVIGGHRYVRIAKELGRKTIRAIVDNRSGAKAVEALKKSRRVVPVEEWDESICNPKPTWHVFYFEGPLTKDAVDKFRVLVEKQFSSLQTTMVNVRDQAIIHGFSYDIPVGRLEFEADTPIADERWIADFLASCREFSKTVCQIKTYQGSIWGNA